VSKIPSFETVTRSVESVERQRQALENLLKEGRISRETYVKVLKGIENRLAEIELQKKALADEATSKINELKNLVELLEFRLADVHARYSAGIIDEENFEHERTIYALGLESIRREMHFLRNALKRLNEKVEVEEEVKRMGEFYFYEDFDKPINQTAHNLQEFLEKLKTVPVASIEFHQKRGDFSNWIRDTLKDVQLAGAIEKVAERGEELRKRLIETVAERIAGPKEAKVLVRCPGCGGEANPIKTWTMTGKPSKAGERIQLTLGNFECPKCDKKFRHIIEKKRIKTP
jgi:predicted RNA-binding Zn-ribbon protein involved in translation (DUF1610 family)